MTTPETARTAEPTTEQVSAYRDYLHYSHPHGRFTYDENAAVLAAIAFVRSCLPEPQASKASEPYTPPPGTPDIRCAMCGSGMMTRLELGRLRKRVAELEASLPSPASDPKCPPGTCRQCDTCRSDSAHPPASEASQCAFSPGVCNDPKCPDCGPLVASAPPPASEAGRPKCPHCGNNVLVVPRGPHLSDEDGDDTRWFGKQWFCNGCCSWFSAPTPPHATGDILDRAVAWVEEKYPTRGHATGELLRECIAEISTLRHAARAALAKAPRPTP